MRTVTNANVKMDSKVTDMSAMFTSHHALATCAVTMKSDKLSQTNMVPKHVSANVPTVSRTLPMVALQWDLATTTTAIQKLLASQLELHTAKDSHANVMMDSSVMVLTSVLPQIHVQTVTPTHHAKPCLATVVKMSRNVFVKPHTLVMVFPAEEVPHAIPTVQEDQSAGMDNVDVSISKYKFSEKFSKISLRGKIYQNFLGANNGYWYNFQTYKCEDKNECKKADKNNCSKNATCRNTNGGFICTCNAGFKGDGVTCLAVSVNIQFFGSMSKWTEM